MEIKDWLPLATASATVVAALIVGWYGGRNARRTPHERLRSLVDIAKDMPPGIDTNDTIAHAIQRELRQFERMNKAHEQSFPRFMWELLRIYFARILGTVVSVFIAGMPVSFAFLYLVGYHGWGPNHRPTLRDWLAPGVVDGALICIGLVLFAFFLAGVQQRAGSRPE